MLWKFIDWLARVSFSDKEVIIVIVLGLSQIVGLSIGAVIQVIGIVLNNRVLSIVAMVFWLGLSLISFRTYFLAAKHSEGLDLDKVGLSQKYFEEA